VLRLGEYRFRIGDFGGRLTQKFVLERSPYTNHSSSHKTRLNDLSHGIKSHGIKICTDLSSVLSQCARLTDGLTDRRTEFSSVDRVCIPCSAVKTCLNWCCDIGLLAVAAAVLSVPPLSTHFVIVRCRAYACPDVHGAAGAEARNDHLSLTARI